MFSQGVLTPFDRLDGYERRIQSGAVAERSAGEASTSGAPSACMGSTGTQYFLLLREYVLYFVSRKAYKDIALLQLFFMLLSEVLRGAPNFFKFCRELHGYPWLHALENQAVYGFMHIRTTASVPWVGFFTVALSALSKGRCRQAAMWSPHSRTSRARWRPSRRCARARACCPPAPCPPASAPCSASTRASGARRAPLSGFQVSIGPVPCSVHQMLTD